jgi:hypothetical protein
MDDLINRSPTEREGYAVFGCLRRGGESGNHRGKCFRRNTKFFTDFLKENCEDRDDVLELSIRNKVEPSIIKLIEDCGAQKRGAPYLVEVGVLPRVRLPTRIENVFHSPQSFSLPP